ncbi:DsbA family protein [Pseudomonas sp. BIC9C]|uniref:DsbA family protein n=1 Tax=Pseudomonas sp. BIC9C TaxID=3078458 RepID=UPI003A522DA8
MKTGDFEGALLSRAGLASLDLGGETAHDALFAVVLTGDDDLLSALGRASFLARNGIDVVNWHSAKSPEIHEHLLLNDMYAASHGVFGVPSFLVGDELFFGNDQLDFVRAALHPTTREGAHP